VEHERKRYKRLGPPAEKLARLLGTESDDVVEGLKKMARETATTAKPKPIERKLRPIRGGKGWSTAA
jgi:hypothetical protein